MVQIRQTQIIYHLPVTHGYRGQQNATFGLGSSPAPEAGNVPTGSHADPWPGYWTWKEQLLGMLRLLPRLLRSQMKPHQLSEKILHLNFSAPVLGVPEVLFPLLLFHLSHPCIFSQEPCCHSRDETRSSAPLGQTPQRQHQLSKEASTATLIMVSQGLYQLYRNRSVSLASDYLTPSDKTHANASLH